MLIQSCLNWGGRSLRALHSSDVFHFNLPLRLMDSPKTRWSIWTPFFSYENVLSVPPSQPSWNLCYWRKHGLVRNFFTFLQWTSVKLLFSGNAEHILQIKHSTKYSGRTLRFLPSESMQLDLRQPTARQNQVSASQDGHVLQSGSPDADSEEQGTGAWAKPRTCSVSLLRHRRIRVDQGRQRSANSHCKFTKNKHTFSLGSMRCHRKSIMRYWGLF